MGLTICIVRDKYRIFNYFYILATNNQKIKFLSSVYNTVMDSFNCQLDTTWEETLNEKLSRSGRSVSMSIGNCFDCYLIWEDPAHCEPHNSLSRGPGLYKSKQTRIHAYSLSAFDCRYNALHSCLHFLTVTKFNIKL